MPADPRLIIALDLPGRAEAEAMVETLGDQVVFYKIGLQMLAVGGMDMARDLKARGRRVFLDWKLHDIGATVEKAAAAIVGSGACDLLTVHAQPQVLEAAVKGRGGEKQAKILGVTVLTSLSGQDLARIGYGMGVEQLVERRIRQVIEAAEEAGITASWLRAAKALYYRNRRRYYLLVAASHLRRRVRVAGRRFLRSPTAHREAETAKAHRG